MPAPGYYPAPHANGELRYWDGQTWADAAAAPTPSAKQPRLVQVRRRTAAWSLTAAGVAGLLFGTMLGNGGASSEVTSLKSELVSVQTAQAEAEEVAADATDQLAELETVVDELDAATTRSSDLEGQLTAVKTESDARQSRIAELEAAVASATAAQPQAEAQPPAAAPQPAPAPAAPANTYFQNCDAARAAGAAPVRAGDPGYGRHLDRDGDGVGCE